MIQIMSSGGKVTYGVNEYVIDKDNEVTKIPNTAAAGSTAYSIESEMTFIKDNGGNWVVKNAAGSNNGGNSIELPDNILYSYEMEYNEFWDKKNNNVLEDGLYKVTLNDAVAPVAETTIVELPSPGLLKGTCDEKLCWILDYSNNALL
jgi:hypothetical protein